MKTTQPNPGSSRQESPNGRGNERGTSFIPSALFDLARSGVVALAFLGVLAGVSAQSVTLPLEFKQARTHYNFQTTNGMPISNTRGTPAGSSLPPAGAAGSSTGSSPSSADALSRACAGAASP